MTEETTSIPEPESQQQAIISAPPSRHLIPAGGAIRSIVPQNMDEVLRIAKVLSNSGDMVPEVFRGKPDAIAAAILRGLDIGLPPLQAVQSIAVIKGKTMLWGDGVKALLFQHGFTVETGVEGSNDQMVGWARVTRPDTGQIVERTFSWHDAKRANLLSKDTYQSYPGRMFQARALAWAARDGAADVLMGLAVVEEETGLLPGMRNITPVEPAAVTGLAAVVARRKAGGQAPIVEEITPTDMPFEETGEDHLDD